MNRSHPSYIVRFMAMVHEYTALVEFGEEICELSGDCSMHSDDYYAEVARDFNECAGEVAA